MGHGASCCDTQAAHFIFQMPRAHLLISINQHGSAWRIAVHEHGTGGVHGTGAVHTAVLHQCSIGQNTGALYRKRQPQAQSLTEAAPSMRAAKLAPTASSMRTAAEATACSDTTQQVTPRMRAGGR